MFAASLSVARVHWKSDDWTVAQLLKEGHTTAAIASMAYLPEVSIAQVNQPAELLWLYGCLNRCHSHTFACVCVLYL